MWGGNCITTYNYKYIMMVFAVPPIINADLKKKVKNTTAFIDVFAL